MVENIKARLVRSIFSLILLFFMKTLLQLAVWNLVKKKWFIAKWIDVRNIFIHLKLEVTITYCVLYMEIISYIMIFLRYRDNIERLNYNLSKIKLYQKPKTWILKKCLFLNVLYRYITKRSWQILHVFDSYESNHFKMIMISVTSLSLSWLIYHQAFK